MSKKKNCIIPWFVAPSISNLGKLFAEHILLQLTSIITYSNNTPQMVSFSLGTKCSGASHVYVTFFLKKLD